MRCILNKEKEGKKNENKPVQVSWLCVTSAGPPSARVCPPYACMHAFMWICRHVDMHICVGVHMQICIYV